MKSVGPPTTIFFPFMYTTEWSGTFTDNFVLSVSFIEQTDDFNWFDDARWDIITQNMATLASLALSTGCKGIMVNLWLVQL